MTWWWQRKTKFNVTLRLIGKHPYITARQDFPDRDVIVSVAARTWDKAEAQAMRCVIDHTWWSARVIAIAKAGVLPLAPASDEAAV